MRGRAGTLSELGSIWMQSILESSWETTFRKELNNTMSLRCQRLSKNCKVMAEPVHYTFCLSSITTFWRILSQCKWRNSKGIAFCLRKITKLARLKILAEIIWILREAGTSTTLNIIRLVHRVITYKNASVLIKVCTIWRASVIRWQTLGIDRLTAMTRTIVILAAIAQIALKMRIWILIVV